MGLGQQIGRFIRGEPVFKPDEVSIEEQQQVAEISPGSTAKDVAPVVRIEKPECSGGDEQFNVYGHITNDSDDRVALKSIRLLGVERELSDKIDGQEAKRLLLYTGLELPRVDDAEAELKYQSGKESYSAHYKLFGWKKAGGAGTITKFELQLPVHKE